MSANRTSFRRTQIDEIAVYQELVRASHRRSAKMIVWRVTWLFGYRNPLSTTQYLF
jgi:hypothetical protein